MSGAAVVQPVAYRGTAPARPALIALDGLRKRFPLPRGWSEVLRHPMDRRWITVLDGVSLEIAEGEFFGLLGPNGAGKTTLFKMLATLITPDAGTARIAGLDVVRDAAAVRRVLAPVIADERSLHWRLSAAQNLELFASLQGLRGREVRSRSGELLEIVGLADVGSRRAGTFSSGMKQRLLLARALVARPRVLLLDEPTRSLDPISARTLRAFLRDEIAGRQGCTVLLATHNAEEASDLCGRVAVLDRGRLLAVGTAQELGRATGQDRYRLWSSAPEHPALRALALRNQVGDVTVRGEEDGWSCIELSIPGENDQVALVLSALTAQGMPVARLERATLSLADLIDRIVRRFGNDAPLQAGPIDA